MPGSGKPLHLLSVTDLWVDIIGAPVFAGMVFSSLLMGTVQEGKEWDWLCMVLIAGGFLGFWATVPSPARLRELAGRGAWVPPGAVQHPVRVAIVLAVLLMAAGVAVMFAVVGVVRLCGLSS